MRSAQRELALAIRDVGFLPEGEIHERSQGTTPYDMGHDPSKYPLERILTTAELASELSLDATPELIKSLEDTDSAVRYWAALGLLMRGQAGVKAGHDSLRSELADPSPYVRIVAAEALARYGDPADIGLALGVLENSADWSQNNVFTAISALNALAEVGDKAADAWTRLRRSPTKGQSPHARYAEYVQRLLDEEK